MPCQAHPIHLDLKRDSLAVMRTSEEIAAFDREGRLLSFFDGGAHYWRGLSGATVRRWTEGGQKHAEVLDEAAGGEVLERARHLLSEVDGAGPQVRMIVERALAWDPDADRHAFQRVYGRIGILPPDQYLSVVLQVATGCSWNHCAFCHFYRDRTFHMRSLGEFRDHVYAVLCFLGESLLLRRSIFLGDADALVIPQQRLIDMLQVATHLLPSRQFYTFAESVSVARRSPQELGDLAHLGLRRVYLGAETGLDRWLERLQKRSRCSDLRAAVAALRQAGLQIGLIFLAGLDDPAHPRATIDLVSELPLEPGDIVYLSRLWGAPDAIADEQMRVLQEGLAYLKPRGVKVAPYDIRQFVY
jgi:hypothetical protein